MILNAEGWYRAMLEALNSVVVEVDMGDFHVIEVQAIRIDGEPMILCGNFDLLPFNIQNGMIAAVVPEFQLVRLASERKAKNLMAQANPEHRLFAKKITDV